MRRSLFLLFLLIITCLSVKAQNIPQSLQYTQIYDFLDEAANEHWIHINAAVQPFTRDYIASLLTEIATKDSLLNKRQRAELRFYLNEFSLERDTVPDNWVEWTDRKTFNLSLAQPSFHYLSPKKNFKMSIKPILGMDIYANYDLIGKGSKGAIINRRWGAELNIDIAHHLSIWGSLRDNSWNGNLLSDDYFQAGSYRVDGKVGGALLTRGKGGGAIAGGYHINNVGPYLNNIPGVQYKEASYGGDFSDSKGGISLYTWWGSLSIQRENIKWGDAYHCSNILSGHNPAVPMISINLKPIRWFEFNWFHAWLNSNVIDTSYYYSENYREGETIIHYRPAAKYMAANMITFSPIRQLSFSVGNSVVYAERSPQALYFIPIAFYKSLDHLATKGLAVENQNSQLFFTINTRNLKHVNFYASFFVDEFSFKRLKKSNPEHNPVSYLVGFNLSNWPLKNLSLKAEFVRSNILCYTHSIDVLDYSSNSYYMGHYMGDNSQNIYAELTYRPVRGLKLSLAYTNDTKYNKYDYIRRVNTSVIANKPFAERIYQNDTFGFYALYEVFSGCYANLSIEYNNCRGFAPQSERMDAEDRGGYDKDGNPIILEGESLQQYYLDMFAPRFLQGQNLTFKAGLTFNF